MKQGLFLICCVFFLLPNTKAQVSFDAKAKAKETVYLLRNAKFETIYRRMDPVMKRIMDEEKIQGFWDILEMSYGSVTEVAEPTISYKDKLVSTVTPIQFERKRVGLKVVFNDKAMISGLFLVSPTPQYQLPDYVDTKRFFENKITLHDTKYPVDGFLTLPKKEQKVPLVILVGNSNPGDKDLTVGPNKVFKDLAWGLANQEIAVFRFEMKTHVYPKEMMANKNLNLEEVYLNDIKKGLKEIKEYPEIDTNRIFILGYDLGGYLLPFLEKNLSGISAYIGVNAAYTNLANRQCYQYDYLLGSANENEKPAFEKALLKAKFARDKLLPTTLPSQLPEGYNANYLIGLNQNNPSKHIAHLQAKRVLFIQCERSFEVPSTELNEWIKHQNGIAEQNWIFDRYPDLNHLGISGVGPAKLTDYEKEGNVSQTLIIRVAAFVLN
ncbi:MAG: DUF3887 domain-containing protein [Bacteroidia bacterium]|nr:DUF3887 domain-containing protein [Bacteroidia bacterium]